MRYILPILALAFVGCAHTSARGPSSVSSLQAQYPQVNLGCLTRGRPPWGQLSQGKFVVKQVFGAAKFSYDTGWCNQPVPVEAASCQEQANGLSCTLGAKQHTLRIEYSAITASNMTRTTGMHKAAEGMAPAIVNSKDGWVCYIYQDADDIFEEEGAPRRNCGG